MRMMPDEPATGVQTVAVADTMHQPDANDQRIRSFLLRHSFRPSSSSSSWSWELNFVSVRQPAGMPAAGRTD
jgi:hypothetical protein